jgi:hypothetical protein
VPIDRRAAEPAPVDRASGNTPSTNARRGHEDRAEAQARGFGGRFENRLALRALLRRELDDQNGVLRRQADQVTKPI